MSQALNRTRRNMIAVSIFMILIYSFGWDFPSNLNVFGNKISASPNSIKFIVWGVLIYLVYEYFVHLRTVSGKLRGKWRGTFVALHHAALKRRMEEKYDEQARERLLRAHKDRGITEVSEVSKVNLVAHGINRFSQDIKIKIHLSAKIGDNSTSVAITNEPLFVANYFRSGHLTLWTWMKLLTTDPEFFEYVFPLVFPILAFLAYRYGPFGFL